MLRLLALATLAVATPAPISVNFTEDSVYKYDSILIPKEVVEQEDGLYTLVFEQDKLLGYCIYDNQETEYLDGLKFDDEFVTNYTVKNVDLSVEHNILIKTTYTNDVAGMLASAKDGDWSRILSNPLILFQIFYYALAAISIIAGGFGLLKARKKKVKSSDEIANAVSERAYNASQTLTKKAVDLVTEIITPVFAKLQSQNKSIIEALILSQTGDKDAKLSLIKLLESTANEDVSLLSNEIIKAIENEDAMKAKVKEEAKKAVEQIAKGEDIGGISI